MRERERRREMIESERTFKGPHKWTFFETCLLHVFYLFLHADYEYNIFRILKKCYDNFLES